jgi:hypothetical protein
MERVRRKVWEMSLDRWAEARWYRTFCKICEEILN